MGWKINYQGAVLSEEDVLNAHVSLANEVLGTTGWDSINPMSSPEALITWTAIAISENTKVPLQEVLVYVQRLKLHDILGSFQAESAPEPAPVVRSEPADSSAGTNGAQLSADQAAARLHFIEQMTAPR